MSRSFARGRLAALFITVLLATGCSHVTDRVVLLPQPDGSPSAVVVQRTGGGAPVTLDQPFQEIQAASDGEMQVAKVDATAVRERYGRVLAAQPPRPREFVVRFEANGYKLTAESEPVIAQMLAAVKDFPAPEVTVIGHTYTVGAADANDRLSLERAQRVVALLAAAGVPTKAIEAVGRGERDLAVQTADGVNEAANRRVEIRIR
jgi:outer membrane protein OmpA-like peptidoglycan-associated protein